VVWLNYLCVCVCVCLFVQKEMAVSLFSHFLRLVVVVVVDVYGYNCSYYCAMLLCYAAVLCCCAMLLCYAATIATESYS